MYLMSGFAVPVCSKIHTMVLFRFTESVSCSFCSSSIGKEIHWNCERTKELRGESKMGSRRGNTGAVLEIETDLNCRVVGS